ncbi:MAG: cupin domain-containing protein [Planctomycetaceae bacterium]|nr:cupin domain-containing protein [Planctomycetaceae bacterium]
MIRTLLTLAFGFGVGAVGVTAAQHEHQGAKVTTLATRDIVEKVDGKEAKVTFQEVEWEAGKSDMPHRHTGPVFGYVLEGEFETALDDQPAKVFKAGETFYEPTLSLHRVSKNASKGKTRVLAVVLHPRDAKDVTIFEPTKK